MPLLRPSPSDFTAVVKALANAGAAVTNPQGSRPPSKGGVAFVNAASVTAMIRGSPRLVSILPKEVAVVAPAPAAIVPLANAGGQDGFVVKYNSEGTIQWISRIGGTMSDSVSQIIVHSSGNIIVLGQYASNPVTIYNTDGTIFTTMANAGGEDSFIVKYNSEGTPQWARRIGGTMSESFNTVRTDSSGNIVVSGRYASNPVTIYNGYNTTETTALTLDKDISGNNDCLVVKYNSEGTPQWARRIGGTGADQFTGLILDSSGNIIVNGRYDSNPVTIYNADGTSAFTLANAGSDDSLLIKYASDGTPQWVRRIGGTAGDYPSLCHIDSSGNIFMDGLYSSNPVTIYNANGTTFTTLANSGSSSYMLIKYASDGTPQWARRIGGTGVSIAQKNATIFDSSGNIIVVGTYNSNSVTIYDGYNTTETTAFVLVNNGNYDGFVVKYNSEGTPQWVRRVGGTGSDTVNSVTTDSSGNIIVAGSYASNPLTIYNADGTTFTTLANAGNSDGFIVKYNSEGTPQWVRRLSGTGDDVARSVSTDSSGSIVVSGYYTSTTLTIYNGDGTTFTTLSNAGGNDGFIVKYNSDGTPLSANRLSGTGNDIITQTIVHSAGNIIVGGYYASNPLTVT